MAWIPKLKPLVDKVTAICDLIENPVEVPVITVDRKSRPAVYAAGEISEAAVDEYDFNSETTRNSVGVYTVVFDTPHPQGNDYVILNSVQSDEPNNDQRKIGFFNKTATGFQIRITVDDNGTAADPEVDEKFDWAVLDECDFITEVYVDGIPAGDQ
jgi:hypothetical protein